MFVINIYLFFQFLFLSLWGDQWKPPTPWEPWTARLTRGCGVMLWVVVPSGQGMTGVLLLSCWLCCDGCDGCVVMLWWCYFVSLFRTRKIKVLLKETWSEVDSLTADAATLSAMFRQQARWCRMYAHVVCIDVSRWWNTKVRWRHGMWFSPSCPRREQLFFPGSL